MNSTGNAAGKGGILMTIAEVRKELFQLHWMAQDPKLPAGIAIAQLESGLGALIERIDAQVPTVRDAKGLVLVDDNGGVEA